MGPAASPLVEAARSAVREARALRAAVADVLASGAVERFPIAAPSRGIHGADGFWFHWEHEGTTTPGMGVIHRLRFPGAQLPAERLEQAVRREFLPGTHWSLPNGDLAGFRFVPAFSLPAEDGGPPAPDDEASEHRVMRIDLLDFFRLMVPLRPLARFLARRQPMGTYVAFHPELHQPVRAAREGALPRANFGWAMVTHRVGPAFLGYGPGQLGSAFKSFDFALAADGSLEVEMVGAMAPRSEKVLDLWGRDPVYGLAHLLDRLTLGRLGIRQAAHDRLDAAMLALHCRVHEAMIRGAVRRWVGGSIDV